MDWIILAEYDITIATALMEPLSRNMNKLNFNRFNLKNLMYVKTNTTSTRQSVGTDLLPFFPKLTILFHQYKSSDNNNAMAPLQEAHGP